MASASPLYVYVIIQFQYSNLAAEVIKKGLSHEDNPCLYVLSEHMVIMDGDPSLITHLYEPEL